MPAERAAALARHLLWYDSAGIAEFGIASLPEWLERLDRKKADPASNGHVTQEHPGTAVVDARKGLAPLVLQATAGLAAEKARDTGVGLVRVRGLGEVNCPVAEAVAELAIGPYAGAAIGPGPRWALALPAPDGLPLVFDSMLAAGGSGPKKLTSMRAMLPLAGIVAPPGDLILLAVAIVALEPLGTFHDHIAGALVDLDEAPGLLRPGPWEEQRRAVRERGIVLANGAMDRLLERARERQIAGPEPLRG